MMQLDDGRQDTAAKANENEKQTKVDEDNTL